MIREGLLALISIFVVTFLLYILMSVYSAVSTGLVSAGSMTVTDPTFAGLLNTIPSALGAELQYGMAAMLLFLFVYILVINYRSEPKTW